MKLLESDDANFHIRGPEADWRESYYCNFVDLKSDLCGVAWQGARPNAGEGEAVFILCDGKNDLIRSVNMHVPVKLEDDPARHIGNQKFVCKKPWSAWDVNYKDENAKIKVNWSQLSDICDYDGYLNSRHLQAAGHVNVSGVVNGRKIEFSGYGERDRAWGVRNYGPIQYLIWLTAQFEDDTALHVFVLNTSPDDPVYTLSGYLHKNGKTSGLASCKAELEYDGERGPPIGGSMTVTDEMGRELVIEEFGIINHVGFGAQEGDASKLSVEDVSKSTSLMFLTFQYFRRNDGVVGKGMVDMNCRVGNQPDGFISLPPLQSSLYGFGR